MESEAIAALNQILEKIAIISKTEKSWLDVWAAPISAIVGIFITAVLSYFLGFRSQVNLADRKLRQKVYGELMGFKLSLSQLYVSRFEAYIFSDFHEKRWLMTGANENSHDFQEAKRWMQKSEELALAISEKQEKVFRTVGIINAVFSDSDELARLVDSVYKYRTPMVKGIPNNNELQHLEAWKFQGVKELQMVVKKEIGDPIDNLLAYLKKHL